MQVTVGYSEKPDSTIAANEAATSALEKAERSDICDIVLLFSTSRHNQPALRAEVAAVTGNSDAIYGGGSVGIITNEAFGYAGDQVGVACIWLEESSCDVIIERDLIVDELEKGAALGRQLKAAGAKEDSAVMLFYDAIRDQGMTMATWLLEGIEKGLGCFPDMNGAGLQGDFISSRTSQFTGDAIERDTALAMLFSDDICIDSVIMHGCHPASPYYTVTKADGPVILEINGEPAIPFLDKLLGPSITPEEYPFFLLLGINHGERWGEYNEKDYASRLCLGIEPERNGIVMFEPDMVPGTEFQVMFRSLDMEYMQPKIDELFASLGDREAVFAVYINCAGRSAGYNGVDIEDAYVIQEAMGDKIPLLGLYTGVEISEIGGRPRGLDWTGVLCLFSVKSDAERENSVKKIRETWQERTSGADSDKEIPIDAALKLAQQNAAKILELDTKSISIRYELELKRRGFKLLSELSATLNRDEANEAIFRNVASRINAALNMQRTMVLVPTSESHFTPSVMQGYTAEEENRLLGSTIFIENELLLDQNKPILVNGGDPDDYLAELREALGIKYFVLIPVIFDDEVTAILASGRIVEAPPFLSRLSQSDVENVSAIGGLLKSVLVYERLDDATKKANTDGLTGLLNRFGLKAKVDELTSGNAFNDEKYALIVIDFDYFKQVNDTYGHLIGDLALKALANALTSSFRSTDLVARIGGDEFVVFFSYKGEVESIREKLSRLIDAWRDTKITASDGTEFAATLSAGLSVCPHDGKTYNELFAKADLALYKAKELGRNQFCLYDESMGN